MNETFKILKGEQKTFSWGTVFKGDVTNATRGEIKQVTIKSEFPNFANLKAGDEIIGVYYKNDKGYVTIYPPKPQNASKGQNGGFKGIEKAQERKADMIGKAQDSKELGIKMSLTLGKGVEIALAHLAPILKEEDPKGHYARLQQEINYWRKWLWQEMDNYPKSPNDYNEPPQV